MDRDRHLAVTDAAHLDPVGSPRRRTDRAAHHAGIAAIAAEPADPDRRRASPRRPARRRNAELAGHVEAARTAAATHRLDQHAGRSATANAQRFDQQGVGRNLGFEIAEIAKVVNRHDFVTGKAGGDDIAEYRGGDIAAGAAVAAKAAKPESERGGRPLGRGDPAADVDSARSAAAANRLGDHAVAARAAGKGVAGARQRDDPAVARPAAEAADADRSAARGAGRQRDRSGHIEAARTATAADGLGGDTGRFSPVVW